MIELMQQLLTTINESVDSDQMVKILKDPNKKRRKKERIIESYKKFLKNKEIVYPTLVVGILDNVYPVVLVGNNGWIKRVVPPRDTDKLDSRKDDRIDNVISGTSQEHIFEIIINEELVFFNLPHFAATKILKRIEKNKDKIAEIQIPFKYSNGTSSVRRIISLNVKMQI
ncbi:MAG: hypothetical protein APR53_09455 [Methanoculleus sp. SDB]|nr:MAG: hypothetical protein APR53_09455 [Methanoculleus sp. SDB]